MKTAAIYARISKKERTERDQSAALDRQIADCRKKAEQMGLTVVGVFADDGVSASTSRPEDRRAWKDALASGADVVIIWKVDRLVRNMPQLWLTWPSLQERKMSLVSVVDNLDLTTTDGQIMASVTAGFAQKEAENIALRVRRKHQELRDDGKWTGGQVPFGYRAFPHPSGEGKVVRRVPEEAEWVKRIVQRTIDGHALFATMRWLNEQGAPSKNGRWAYTSLDRLVRNPIIAGQTSTGRRDAKDRAARVLRDDKGQPVIDAALAIIDQHEWRALQAKLTEAVPQRAPRGSKRSSSHLLSGLVFCGEHNVDDPTRMWRGRTDKGTTDYNCPTCRSRVSNFEDFVVEEFLATLGDHVRFTVIQDVYESRESKLTEINTALDELAVDLRAAKSAARIALIGKQTELLDRLDEIESEPARVVETITKEGGYFDDEWAAAGEDVDAQRDVIGDAIERVWIKASATRGSRSEDARRARLVVEWKVEPRPVDVPNDATLAAWAADSPL